MLDYLIGKTIDICTSQWKVCLLDKLLKEAKDQSKLIKQMNTLRDFEWGAKFSFYEAIRVNSISPRAYCINSIDGFFKNILSLAGSHVLMCEQVLSLGYKHLLSS